jgi:ectoine hydroxylase-related dioxygenase (phytanoyl-CoA dioxygenase family)
MPAPLVHPDLTDRLDRDGYAVVEDFLSAAEVGHLFNVFQSLDSPTHHGGWSASMFSSDLAYRAAVDRAIKAALTAHAAALLPGYRICFCNFLVKEPQREDAGGVVQIHQDPTFVDETRHDSLGLWVPLVDTDAANGGISVLPGSHRLNHGPRTFGGAASPYLDLLPAFLEHAQPLSIKAGAALVFSQKLFRGSPTNHGGRTRITAAALLAPAEAQLLCYHSNPSLPGKVEVFEVDDVFYNRYIYATRPVGVPRVAVIDHGHDPIRPEQLAARERQHVVR